MALTVKERTERLAAIVDNLSPTERGPPSQKYIHLLAYVGVIGTHTAITDGLVKHGAIAVLAQQAKDTQQVELLVLH